MKPRASMWQMVFALHAILVLAVLLAVISPVAFGFLCDLLHEAFFVIGLVAAADEVVQRVKAGRN